MRIPVTLVLALTCSMKLCAADDALLSAERRTALHEQEKELNASARALRYNWLSPLNLSLSHHRQKQPSETGFDGVNRASASLSQDLFRSGGIYYAIRYADRVEATDRLAWIQTRDAQFEQIYTAVLNIRKYRLLAKQSTLRLENSEITVFLKQKQYEAGEIDITLLNDAIMQRNSEQKSLLALQESLEEWQLELEKYSDREADAIGVPEFALLEESAYLSHNYTAKKAAMQSDVADAQYRVAYAGYLPALSLDASAGYTDYEKSSSDDGVSYSVGITLSMPLDYTAQASVQARRAAMLRQKAESAVARRDARVAYRRTLNAISRYRSENDVVAKNLELYVALIDVTQKGFDNGYKTGYDLKTLQNTKRIDELEMDVNELNIQLALCTLHFAVDKTGGE